MSETDSPEVTPVGSGRPEERLHEAFTVGDLPVAVYGLGKMGLPLAATFADRSGNVRGVDVDPAVVDRIEDGECPVDGEPGLPQLVEACVARGALSATTDGRSAANRASIHVVIVPTLLDDANEPDLTHLRAAVETIGSGLEVGDVVFVESTVPPRTCNEVVGPALAAESGLAPGEFGLAFCPERTASGRALRDIRSSYPKVVGGIDEDSTRVARAVYGEITDDDVLTVAGPTTAECVKIFEGVYRDVNIALANELATFTDELGVDVLSAIEVANSVPYCDLHTPGAGVGGHCIPYYPYFLLNEFRTPGPLLATARRTNEAMPRFAVERLVELLGKDAAATTGDAMAGTHVVVLGVTYRPGVDEIRASPAHDIVGDCRKRGADVSVVDPVCTELGTFGANVLTVDEFQASRPDGVVLVTDQRAFDRIDWDAFAPMVVVDGRQALDLVGTDHRVYTIGRGRTN